MKAYVRLLDDGTDVCREIEVEKVETDLYRIEGDRPEDENWEFKPGAVVRLVERNLSEGPVLIAMGV
jgi:hypothetical protein